MHDLMLNMGDRMSSIQVILPGMQDFAEHARPLLSMQDLMPKMQDLMPNMQHLMSNEQNLMLSM